MEDVKADDSVFSWRKKVRVLPFQHSPPVTCSSTRVYPSSNIGNGYHLPGEERNGEDGRVRACNPSADRSDRRSSVRSRALPRQGAGLSDLQGIREVLEVFRWHKVFRLLRWNAHLQRQGDPEEQVSAHRSGDAWEDPRIDQREGPESEACEAFHSG